MMSKLVLRDERTATDRRTLVVERRGRDLHIDGWELGDLCERVHGDREYEWTIDVAAADVPALVVALGGLRDEDVLAVIARACADRPERLVETIRARAIPHRFWMRLGD